MTPAQRAGCPSSTLSRKNTIYPEKTFLNWKPLSMVCVELLMLNCLIIDDDPAASTLLKHCVESTEGLQLAGVLSDGISASNFLRKNEQPIDVVFMDVEMPGMTGIELLESSKNLPPVVLVTSKEKYAAKAFEFRVAHYLVKPVDYTRFLSAIDRIQDMKKSTQTEPSAIDLDYIFVKENGLLHKIPYKDLSYVEALGDYMKVHTKAKTFTTYSTMKNLEEKLCSHPSFVRVHRSYIINISFLENIDNEAATICGHVVPIGNKYRPSLQQRLNIL